VFRCHSIRILEVLYTQIVQTSKRSIFENSFVIACRMAPHDKSCRISCSKPKISTQVCTAVMIVRFQTHREIASHECSYILGLIQTTRNNIHLSDNHNIISCVEQKKFQIKIIVVGAGCTRVAAAALQPKYIIYYHSRTCLLCTVYK